MPRHRGAGRGLGACRRDGRAFRAQHHLRPRHLRGDPAAYQGHHGRASDDRAGRSLYRGLRPGGGRYHDRPCRGRAAYPPHVAGHPCRRRAAGGGDQSGHAGRGGGRASGPCRPGLRHDGQPRFRRAEIHPLADRQDCRVAGDDRRPADPYRDRRWRRYHDRAAGGGGRRRCAGGGIGGVQGRQRRGPRRLWRQYRGDPQGGRRRRVRGLCPPACGLPPRYLGQNEGISQTCPWSSR